MRRNAIKWIIVCLAFLCSSSALAEGLRGTGAVDFEEITPQSRQAIERGLAYLASIQSDDGSFGADRYGRHVGITSVAAMAFMADGHLPGRGVYRDEVEQAIAFVLDSATESGLLAADTSHGPMYGHGFATLMLGEAYGMTQDPRLRESLLRAVRLIVNTQNHEGGWRYQPVPFQADISVTICQVMALRSARNAGLSVPKATIDRAISYVRRCQNPADGGFRYMISTGGSAFPRSAAGVATLYYAGIYEDDAIDRGLDYLVAAGETVAFSERAHYYFYGHYYAAQAMYLAGGEQWKSWYPKIREDLIQSQRPDGSWDSNHGKDYGTSMALLVLQMPNRLLPIFQKIRGKRSMACMWRKLMLSAPVRCSASLLMSVILVCNASADRLNAVLIDRDLEVSEIQLASVGYGGLGYFNDLRELSYRPIGEVVRIELKHAVQDRLHKRSLALHKASEIPIGKDSNVGLLGQVVVVLIDGQRYVGAHLITDSDLFTIEHPVLGVMSLPLEHVSRVDRLERGLLPDSFAVSELVEDVVVMTNGDRMVGFVERITADGVVFLLDGAEAITVAHERLKSVILANPRKNEPMDQHRVLLVDGSRIYGSDLQLASAAMVGDDMGRFQLDAWVPGGGRRTVEVDLSWVERVDFAGHRLVPWQSLEVTSVTPADVFGIVLSPVQAPLGWRVHAPGGMKWRLPAGARLVAIETQLDTADLTQQAMLLADCHVYWSFGFQDQSQGKQPLGDRRIYVESAERNERIVSDSFSLIALVPQGASEIQLRLDVGKNASVADRVSVKGLGVLVAQPIQSQTSE